MIIADAILVSILLLSLLLVLLLVLTQESRIEIKNSVGSLSHFPLALLK